MKTSIKIFAVAVLFFSVSCTKDGSSSTKAMSQQEVIAQLDSVGIAVLKQIVPEDLRNLVYIVSDGVAVIKGKGTSVVVDSAVLGEWAKQMSAFIKGTNSTGGYNYVFDGNLCGKAGLNLTAGDSSISYTYNGEAITFDVTSRAAYSGDLKIICDNEDSVCLGLYAKRGKSLKDTLYTYLPTKVESSIKFKGVEYAKMDFKTDFSAMGGWDLSDIRSILFNLDSIAFSVYGKLDINGENSYSVKLSELSVEKNLGININATLCGKDGGDIATFVCAVSKDTEAISLLPVFKSEWGFNILDGSVIVASDTFGVVYVYFPGYADPQMTINIATQTVSFADGTIDTVDNVFKPGNFADTVIAAFNLIIEFKKIIDGK